MKRRNAGAQALLILLLPLHVKKNPLITGGAGFIGSHLAGDPLRHGYQIRALDCFCPLVHIDGAGRPSYLSSGMELLTGELPDREPVRRALQGVDAAYHFAARARTGAQKALAES